MKEIEKMVRDRLTWDDRIDESQIKVSIKEGIATLKGCVSSYPERVLAEIETQMVTKIKSVVNEIEVKFPDSLEMHLDQDIKEAMYCLLNANSEIKTNDVKVSINNGIIFLEGTVNSFWKSDKIRKMASKISGVISVTNKITVIPDEKFSDEEIANLIFTSMQNCVQVDVYNINVEVEAGIVSLSGILSSMSEYDEAIDIVKSTKGVVDIKNSLKWVLRYQTT